MKKILVSLLVLCLAFSFTACGSSNAADEGNTDAVVDTVETEAPVVDETEAVEPETEPVVEEPETEAPVVEPETEAAKPAPQEPVVVAPVEPETEAPVVETEAALEKSPYSLYTFYYDTNTNSLYYNYIKGLDEHNYFFYLHACEYYTQCTGKTGSFVAVSTPLGTYEEGEVIMAQIYIP